MSHDFQPLTVTAVRRETADAISLALAVPEARKSAFAFKPGQHLVVRAILDGAEVRRTYSICSGPGDRDLWITIKRVEGGLYSPHAHGLAVGASLEVMAPSGRFVMPPSDGTSRTLVCIAAGSGITPIMAMIQKALETEPETHVILIYGNRSTDSIIFRQALEDLKDRFMQRFTLLHVLSRDPDTDVPELAGRIDGAKVERLLRTLVKVGDIDHAFLCGPDTLIKDVRAKLMELGLPRDRVHFEFFRAGSEAEQRRAPVKREAVVGVAANGAGRHSDRGWCASFLQAARRAHVVDAALAAGIRVPYSCKGGMCCTCRAKIVEGQAEMSRNFSLEPWEVEQGFVLTCQAQARSPRLASTSTRCERFLPALARRSGLVRPQVFERLEQRTGHESDRARWVRSDTEGAPSPRMTRRGEEPGLDVEEFDVEHQRRVGRNDGRRRRAHRSRVRMG